MQLSIAAPLLAWANFYVIVGSSAAALTGLMFVVVTLLADTGGGGPRESVSAFGTPTIVHFCSALLASAIMSAPWHTLTSVAFALYTMGAAGVAYAMIVLARALRQTAYKPVLEDWLFHTVFPLASYAAVIVSAFWLPTRPGAPLFLVAAATLGLLFIGIHNAWDTVTYITFDRPDLLKSSQRTQPGPPAPKPQEAAVTN